jgi:hypothetical protein
MAIDLDAIKRRMEELKGGNRKTSSVQLWKPGVGEYKVRCLPWKTSSDGQPFQERWFYYIGTNAGILTPKQFGKPDPIDDLIRKLFNSGKPDERVLAKKLLPKMRAYAPVVVRGQEDKGVMVWSFGKLVYQQLLSFFVDEDYGNILDPREGFDLKVVISQAPGKQFQDTVVSCKPKSSKLHDDQKIADSWLESVPNLDDMYRLKGKDEIEQILNTWLNSGSAEDNNDEGSTRGSAAPSDALDQLVNEVSGKTLATPKVDNVSTPKKPAPRRPKVDDDDADAPPAKKQTIDEAFAELNED